MQIRLFTIPISDNGVIQTELNKFLSANKVLEIGQQFYHSETGAAWCFCVKYLSATVSVGQSATSKTDYKNVLGETEFIIFSKLREIRKQLAAQDAVPAFAVFTDAELAEISKLSEISEKELIKLKGIAEKRMKKYGNVLVARYKELKQ